MARPCRCGEEYKADTAMRGVRWCPHCDTGCPLRPCKNCIAIDVSKTASVYLDDRPPRLEPPTE
jgi:hypothetical protein